MKVLLKFFENLLHSNCYVWTLCLFLLSRDREYSKLLEKLGLDSYTGAFSEYMHYFLFAVSCAAIVTAIVETYVKSYRQVVLEDARERFTIDK